jgi:hypothetical protein
MEEALIKDYIDRVIVPRTDNKEHLLIMDQFRAHMTSTIKQKLDDVNVTHYFLPASFTHCLQPLDVSVNKTLKDAFKENWNNWFIKTSPVYTKGNFFSLNY